jgi:hypothetical protein
MLLAMWAQHPAALEREIVTMDGVTTEQARR